MTVSSVCSWKHQFTSDKDDGQQRTNIWNLLSMWQRQPFGKVTALVLTADCMLFKMDKQDTKEGDCQTFTRQGGRILQNSWFTKCMSHILGLLAKDGCPNIREKPCLTAQTARCLCHFKFQIQNHCCPSAF